MTKKNSRISDLRRLQLPTRLEISNFRSDVDTSTSTNSISQTSGNVNPSGENNSRNLEDGNKWQRKIREFSDLRRLQLPTRLEISNFRSDVDASTSTNSISQNSENVNPRQETSFFVVVGLSNICYTFAIKIIGKVLVRRLPVEWRRKIACLFVLQKIYIRYVESH